MFYNIIKKLSRYVVAMCLMIAGHAFAFMIVNYGHIKDSFESPWKSFVMDDPDHGAGRVQLRGPLQLV